MIIQDVSSLHYLLAGASHLQMVCDIMEISIFLFFENQLSFLGHCIVVKQRKKEFISETKTPEFHSWNHDLKTLSFGKKGFDWILVQDARPVILFSRIRKLIWRRLRFPYFTSQRDSAADTGHGLTADLMASKRGGWRSLLLFWLEW